MKIIGEYLILALLVLSIEAKDYYKILGIKKTASDKEVKKAFREKAKLLHPDKNDSPDAEQQFRDLAEAYEVLSDSQKRSEYDGRGRSGKPFTFTHGTRATNFDFNFDDLFAQFETDIFGDMKDSMHFGSHFSSHFASHKRHHQHHHQKQASFSFDDIFNDIDLGGLDMNLGGGFGRQAKQHCKTVTQVIGNMVKTYTHCS